MDVIRFEQTVTISRPAAQVFAFVSDLENDPVWTGASSVRRTSPGPTTVGTTFEQNARFLGRNMTLRFHVTAFEPGRQIAVSTSHGPLSLFGARAVEPAGESTSRVTVVGGGQASGVWRLMERPLGRLGARGLRHMLRRLERTLETPAMSTPAPSV